MNSFLEKLQVDVRDALLLKQQLSDRTDRTREDASRYLSSLQGKVRKAYAEEDKEVDARKTELETVSRGIYSLLDRIANL